MLIQSYVPDSNEDDVSVVSDFGEKSCLFDWRPAAETWQMGSKSEISKGFGRGAAVGTTSRQREADGGCSSRHIRSCSQFSAISNTSESPSPNIVYKRKRFLKDPAALPWARVSANTSPDAISFVYERRKHQRSAATNFSTVVSANTSPYGASSSAIRPENPTAASMENTSGTHETVATRVSLMSAIISSKQPQFTTSDMIEGCSFDNQASHSKNKLNKTVELYSVDDSCSSSMLNMDAGLIPLKTEIDDTDECSSSGALVSDEMKDDPSLLVKGLCISILESHRLRNKSGPLEEDAPSCSGSSCSRSCNVCGLNGIATEMLICDGCEEAFHLSCFNPSIKRIPTDDWYCQSCFKKKHNFVKERAVRKSIFGSVKGSATSEGQSSAIELMLKDTEPYITGVRVGKGFQAIVPEWSGPITEHIDVLPEPMELDLSYAVNLPGLIAGKPRKSIFIGNWLQCRQVLIGLGAGVDGTICGKWRRAPLFEVQSDKWDCFCSVFWDPTYADCSVPQELETEEVLKQLKYIEMLRPRLAAKRRRLDICKGTGTDGSQVPIEDASVGTV